MAIAVISSPVQNFGSQRCFCSLGAQIDQVRRDAVGVDADAGGVREGELGQLFGQHHREPGVLDTGPAVLGRGCSVRADPACPAPATSRDRTRGSRCAFPGWAAAAGPRRSGRSPGRPRGRRRRWCAALREPPSTARPLRYSPVALPVPKRFIAVGQAAPSLAETPDPTHASDARVRQALTASIARVMSTLSPISSLPPSSGMLKVTLKSLRSIEVVASAPSRVRAVRVDGDTEELGGQVDRAW